MNRNNSHKTHSDVLDPSNPLFFDVRKSTFPLTFLKQLTTWETGWTPSTSDLKNYGTGYKWAKISDLGSRFLHDTETQITDHALMSRPRKEMAAPGDLLFSFKLSVGKSSIASDYMYTNEAIAVFKQSDKFYPVFGYYAFPIYLQANANINIYGAPLLNADIMQRSKVPMLSFDEQKRIADYLDQETAETDELIENFESLLLGFKNRKLQLAHEFFENPQHQKMPIWILGRKNQRKNTHLKEQNLLSLSYGNIVQKDIDDPKGLRPASYEGYQIVEEGYTILRFTDLQNDKTSLRSGYVTEKGIISSAYLGFVPNEDKIFPSYFAHAMRYLDTKKVFYGLGDGVRQALAWDEFSKLKIAVPPLEKQKEIATYLDQETQEIDEIITNLTELINALKKRKTTLITQVVTGQKEI